MFLIDESFLNFIGVFLLLCGKHARPAACAADEGFVFVELACKELVQATPTLG
jgi:hypothetical protein